MEYSIKFDTVKSGWPIVYIEGPQVIIFKIYYISLKIDLVLVNSAEQNEMHHFWVFTVCHRTCLGTS